MAAPRKEGKQSSETKTVLMREASQGLRGARQLASRLVWGQRLRSATALQHPPHPTPRPGQDRSPTHPRVGLGRPWQKVADTLRTCVRGLERPSWALLLGHRGDTEARGAT